ncbi:hypothetical protein P405_17505 [Streptomyces sp. FR-008]|nr:hypothetical protein P405_17505 [Streptomyces sp. FR-008]
MAARTECLVLPVRMAMIRPRSSSVTSETRSPAGSWARAA